MMRRIATILQRAPWIAVVGHHLWRWRQPKYSVGAVGVVFNKQGQVLLVEHVFHPHAPWGLPGGWVGRDENPAHTVARELREELELDVEVGKVLLLEMEGNSHIDLAYSCQQTGPVGMLSAELLNYGWYDPAKLPRLHQFHYRAIMRALDTVELSA
jgi:8-oxo-dGTP pyrophosphatase MutT (NUDIX family)